MMSEILAHLIHSGLCILYFICSYYFHQRLRGRKLLLPLVRIVVCVPLGRVAENCLYFGQKEKQ